MKIQFWGLLLLLVMMASCEQEKTKSGSTLDRGALLESFADRLIIPSFNSLKATAEDLYSAVQTFNANPDLTNLQQLKAAWQAAALAFQKVNAFNFGPAESNTGNLTSDLATFPSNASTIESFVAQMGSTGFDPLNNFSRDTRGLFGMEYLLYSQDESSTLAAFSGTSGSTRRNYLLAIAGDFRDKSVSTANAWPAYRSTFINAKGTDAGGSTSQLFNHMLISYENVKNYKLGLPLGVRAGQTAPEPALCEALYSGISVELIRAHFEAIRSVYYGLDQYGADGIGFDDYLRGITNGDALVNETTTQFDAVRTKLQSIPLSPLSQQVISAPQPATEAYLAMQQLTRYIKTDMSSLMGISITYSSGDGD